MDENPVILDGGLATELEAAGFQIQGDPLWSAKILHTNPQAVKEAHCRLAWEGFIQHLGLTPEQANQLLMSGVQLAKEAVQDFKGDGVHPEAVQLAGRCKQLVAVGVNCCDPVLVEPLLESAGPHRSPDLSWVVYPNRGEEWVQGAGWKTSESKVCLADLSPKWRRQWAAWIGGCCRVSPADIAAVRQQLHGST
ncbi:hypothetical protein AAFF_G00050180 [Aldrovandia affinis]|uniref:Hcy-binding domain-containing protein n=1 Tax=Aldrovandia affinis TaxID=143900 RepID=A0AAD7R1Z1_9TELE|nr:hypothetical protein AAFF_G00050180 [Aldrovandia affinis]